jgi:hypothetical protein
MLHSLSILVLGVLTLPAFAQAPKSGLKPAKDTTFVTEPLDDDGYVDYEAALNKRLKGTTRPDTNAVVLLLNCFGPKPDGRELHADFHKALGVDPPPAEGKYLIGHLQFFKDEFKDEVRDEFLKKDAELLSRPWRPAESPRHVEWLKANEEPLAHALRALERKDYYLPVISRQRDGKKGMLIGASLQVVQLNRDLATCLALRVMLRLGEGQVDEALDDALAIHKLGRMTARGASLIELLVGVAVEGIAHRVETIALEKGRPNARQALGYLRKLRELPLPMEFAERIHLNDRLTMLDAIQSNYREGFDIREPLQLDRKRKKPKELERFQASIDWDVVLRMANGWFDRVVAALRNPDRAERLVELKRLEAELKNIEGDEKARTALEKFLRNMGPAEAVRAATSDRVGKAYLCLLAPAFSKILESFDRHEQTLRNGIVAAALAAHFADHGKYPAKLEDLSPKYLAEVPNDVFNGKRLIYRKEDAGFVFYGVGINGKDDGGRFYNDEPRGDDWGVRVPSTR